MNEWLTAKELAGLTMMPKTESGVIRKALAEQWSFRDVPGKGGPRGMRRQYHISALPEETRVAILTAAACPAPAPDAEPAPETTPEALEAYLSTRRITLSPAQLADPALQRKLAVARAVNACPAYSGREKLISSLASEHGVTPITIRRWVDYVETLPARTSKPRVKLGDERIDIPETHAFTPEALACGLMSYANDMKAGLKSAYRAMQSQAPSREWRMGDYVSFTRLVKKLPDALWLRIRKGAIGFELHGLPKIIKQWTAIPVQSVLCGDQKIFDYTIYDPKMDELINPNGYLWMDCSSRMINGASIEFGHYNSYTVANALRHALSFGNPDELYTDWGKPEGSKHIAGIRAALNGHSLSGDFQQMEDKYGLFDEDVKERKSRPGVPWVKPIENINNLIEQRLTSKGLPGYRKRKGDAWENKEVQELLKKQAKKGMLMTPERFVTEVYTVIDEHNRAQKVLKEGRTIIPLDFFHTGLMTQRRDVFDSTTLNYICLPRVARQPLQCVVSVMVRREKRGYYSPKLSGWRKGKVWVAYDPYDRYAPAVISDERGDIIDIAGPWHVQNPYDKEGVSEKRHRQAELMKWVNEHARRLKEGFDLYKPEVMEKAPIKLTSVTGPAAEAEKGVKIYHLRKQEERQETKRIAQEAARGQKELEAEFAAVASNGPAEIDGWSLGEGRDRYIFWLTLSYRVTLDQALTEKEQYFYTQYPNTGDYRSCRTLHEDFGEKYIGGDECRSKPRLERVQ